MFTTFFKPQLIRIDNNVPILILISIYFQLPCIMFGIVTKPLTKVLFFKPSFIISNFVREYTLNFKQHVIISMIVGDEGCVMPLVL